MDRDKLHFIYNAKCGEIVLKISEWRQKCWRQHFIQELYKIR